MASDKITTDDLIQHWQTIQSLDFVPMYDVPKMMDRFERTFGEEVSKHGG